MSRPYFLRVVSQTPTELWVNNPTREHTDLAIANGATGCTTNPSFTQKMVDHPVEGPYALPFLDEAIRKSENDDEVAAIFQRRLVGPIAEKFMPVFRQHRGDKGYVTIQGDPIHEDNPDVVIREALESRKVSPNICCKIPTTKSGLAAMEYLVGQDVPMNATEMFGINQCIALCETYLRSSKRTGKRPKLYISHIAGIYDDHFRNVVERDHIDISPDVLWQAGLAVARKLYALIEERGYPCTFVGGGARGLHHFTEMVGGKVCCTINWEGTADELLKQNPPVVYRLFNPVPQKVIDELMEKLPDFRRGYQEDGLAIEEFEDFGPVRLFRGSFIKSWNRVLKLIKERRAVKVMA
ncbi:MAG: transaldolase family protein [Terriglobales bacterium]|jgi:transaldolase